MAVDTNNNDTTSTPAGETHEQKVARRQAEMAAERKAAAEAQAKIDAEKYLVTPDELKSKKVPDAEIEKVNKDRIPVAIPVDAAPNDRKALLVENEMRGWTAYQTDGEWRFAGKSGQPEPKYLLAKSVIGEDAIIRAPEPRAARDGQAVAAPKVSEGTAERIAARNGLTEAGLAERAGSAPEAELNMRRYMSGWIVQSSRSIMADKGRPPTFGELQQAVAAKGISLTESYDSETGRNTYFAGAKSNSGKIYQASDRGLGLIPEKGRDLDLLIRTGEAAKEQEAMGAAWAKVAESPTWNDLVETQRRVTQKDIEKLATILEKQTGGKYQLIAMNKGLHGQDRDGTGLIRYDVGIRGEDGKARSLKDLGIGDLSATLRRDGQEPLVATEHKSELAKQWADFKSNLKHETKTMFGAFNPAAFAGEKSIYAESPEQRAAKREQAVVKPSQHYAQRGGAVRGPAMR